MREIERTVFNLLCHPNMTPPELAAAAAAAAEAADAVDFNIAASVAQAVERGYVGLVTTRGADARGWHAARLTRAVYLG